MSQKSPLALVNEKFGGKDKLVDKLVAILESDEPKDELRKTLLGAANKKLLRLHAVASLVKEKYGSRDKLIQAVVAGQNRAKDKDYVAKLDEYSAARLVDAARVGERKAKRAAAPAAKREAKAAPKAKKPAAKGAPAKKSGKSGASSAAK